MHFYTSQDSFHIERLDKYMGHGFGIADNVFAAHFGEGFLYGVDMLGPHPGETLEPTLEGAKVLQVGVPTHARVVVFCLRPAFVYKKSGHHVLLASLSEQTAVRSPSPPTLRDLVFFHCQPDFWNSGAMDSGNEENIHRFCKVSHLEARLTCRMCPLFVLRFFF